MGCEAGRPDGGRRAEDVARIIQDHHVRGGIVVGDGHRRRDVLAIRPGGEAGETRDAVDAFAALGVGGEKLEVGQRVQHVLGRGSAQISQLRRDHSHAAHAAQHLRQQQRATGQGRPGRAVV